MKKILFALTLACFALPLLGGSFQAKSSLTKDEASGIVFMREEEKLARDVYNALAVKWGARPFSNIAKSEQTHMDAVKTLINRYGLKDPVAEDRPGKFENTELQKLYDDLIKRGSTSRIEALKVGALIEDLDLRDLDTWTGKTLKADIKVIYDNLARGSRNHLRSFVSVLKRSGGTYAPRFITKEKYDQILASPMERGGG